ncbi:hypothetical protein PMIN07_004226 [Paraphaeosphaeria minitans]
MLSFSAVAPLFLTKRKINSLLSQPTTPPSFLHANVLPDIIEYIKEVGLDELDYDKMAGDHTAFFYGTLMAPPVLHRVIWGQSTPPTPAHASLLHIRPAILHAHQRRQVRHADYPAVLPSSPSSSVRGTLVTGLTDGDIWRLDIFEGDMYERRKVHVRYLEQKDSATDEGEGGMGDLTAKEEDNIEGEEVEAETYIWVAPASHLQDEEWDFGEFVRDKMKRWVGREAAEMDDGFQDVDDAVAAGKDPTGGRGANGSITRQLEKEGKTEEKAAV